MCCVCRTQAYATGSEEDVRKSSPQLLHVFVMRPIRTARDFIPTADGILLRLMFDPCTYR